MKTSALNQACEKTKIRCLSREEEDRGWVYEHFTSQKKKLYKIQDLSQTFKIKIFTQITKTTMIKGK